MNDARLGDWTQTYSGIAFWPLDPRPEEVLIEDIAHALSLLCRYGGHTRKLYSVAQHSVLVARNLPPELQLEGLLHDAAEAFVVDLVRPVKNSIPEYRTIEHGVAVAVGKRFNIPAEMHPEVKRVDNAILADEAAQLMKTPPRAWTLPEPALGIKIEPWSARKSKRIFLREYYRLSGTRPVTLIDRIMQRIHNMLHARGADRPSPHPA